MDKTALITILGMTLVTVFTRAAGLWTMNRVRMTPRLEACLSTLPGTILVSLIAPNVFTAGRAEALAGLVTLLVAICSKNFVAAMVSGVVAVYILRNGL